MHPFAGRSRSLIIALGFSALTLPIAAPALAADPGGPWKRGKVRQAAVAPVAATTAASIVTPPETPRPTGPRQPATVPASIAADCSTDVSDALNAWFDGLPSSDVEIVFPVGGCFRTERAITIKGKTGWVVDGNGSELRRTQATPTEFRYPKNNRHLAVVDSQDLTLREFRVVGLNTVSDVPKHPDYGTYVRDLEFEHAYSAWNSTRLVFADLYADAPYGDGVYLHSNTSDVAVEDVDIARNGRQGIGVLASRVLIDGATIRSSRRAGVDLEPDTAAGSMSDVEVRNSTISSHLLAFASAGPGHVDRIHLHHNTIAKTGVPFISALRTGYTRNQWVVEHNWVTTSLGSTVAAMRFGNADGVIIRHNIVKVSPKQSRLIFDVAEGSAVVATCNSFQNALADPVSKRDGSGTVTFVDNSFDHRKPGCLDEVEVGAPRATAPAPAPVDDSAGAIGVERLTPGATTSPYDIDNGRYTLERWESKPLGGAGRTAWLRYTTGATDETIKIVTTGVLRNISLFEGESLYWSRLHSQHSNTGVMERTLAANTSYLLGLDDSPHAGSWEQSQTRSVRLLRTK